MASQYHAKPHDNKCTSRNTVEPIQQNETLTVKKTKVKLSASRLSKGKNSRGKVSSSHPSNNGFLQLKNLDDEIQIGTSSIQIDHEEYSATEKKPKRIQNTRLSFSTGFSAVEAKMNLILDEIPGEIFAETAKTKIQTALKKRLQNMLNECSKIGNDSSQSIADDSHHHYGEELDQDETIKNFGCNNQEEQGELYFLGL